MDENMSQASKRSIYSGDLRNKMLSDLTADDRGTFEPQAQNVMTNAVDSITKFIVLIYIDTKMYNFT